MSNLLPEHIAIIMDGNRTWAKEKNLSTIKGHEKGLDVAKAICIYCNKIGIMNVMLVSVTERTKEIGIRITIGATRKDIIFQFLSESALLSFFGGVVGISLGYTLSQVASSFVGWPAIISTKSIAAACIFSAFIGIFFGIYPAYKAAKLDPIKAIRNEE